MKKFFMYASIVIAIIVLFLIDAKIALIEKRSNKSRVSYFEYKQEKPDYVEYVGTYNERRVFFYGLSSLKYNGEDFLTYLNKNSVDDIKKLFNEENHFMDGGSSLVYCSDKTECDDSIKINYCNRTGFHTDIYIGDSLIPFEVKVCGEMR